MTSMAHRYYARATYQRNMLIAQLAVIIIAGAAVIGIWLSDTHGDLPSNAATAEGPGGPGDSDVTAPEAKAGTPYMTLLNPFAGEHAGFLGFDNLRITASLPVPIPISQPETVDGYDDVIFDRTDVLAYSSDVDADVGYYPSIGTAVGGGNSFEVLPDTTSPVRTSRPVMVIGRVRPKVPPIARWNDKEGYVEILLLIDSTGQASQFSCRPRTGFTASGEPVFELEATLKNGRQATLEFYIDATRNDLLYVQLQEQPKEYHFAEYLLDVLPQWKFAPAICNGRPVSSFVVLQYRFCRESELDCKRLLLKSLSS